MSDYILTPDGELYHYGVPGMKWGKRKTARLTQKADKYAARANRSKTSFGKRYNIAQETSYRLRADRRNRIGNAKTLKEAMNEGFGDRNASATQAGQAKMYSRMADASKGRLNKALYKQSAANAKELSKYYASKDKMTKGKKFVENNIYSSSLMKTPYHRLSGRTTTYGKQLVDNLFTGGLYGLAKDVQYKRNQKKGNKK